MVETKKPILTALDRCDQCGAQAYVMVKGISGELSFCAHHYNSIMNDKLGYEKMMKFMFEIIDERDRLIETKTKE